MTITLRLEDGSEISTFRGKKIIELTIAGDDDSVLNLHAVIKEIARLSGDLAVELFDKESPCDLGLLVLTIVTATYTHVIRANGTTFSKPFSMNRQTMSVRKG